MRSEPYIEISHSDNSGAAVIAGTYNVDKGPLAMPAHIHIGAKSYDGSILGSFANQVEEYDVWLEEQIQNQNIEVMQELDKIYHKALDAGVILITKQVPSPYITVAHVIKRTIENLL